tara:strand:+ start:5 stop:1906 length:1902 start_codon:yes stop_codon:yes gene_type:complete
MMGRCKKNAGTNAPIMANTGIGGNTMSDRPWVKVDGVWTRDPLPGETGGPGTIPPWRGGDGRLGGGTGNNNKNVNIVANQILNEINKDVNKAVVAGVNNNNGFNANAEFNKQMALRTNGVNNRKLSKNNKALVANVTSGIINNVVRKDINKRINSRNLVAVSNKTNLNGNAKLNNMNLNNATKNIIRSINKATTLKELRKIYLKGALNLHPNKGGNKGAFSVFKKAHTKKQKLLEAGNTKSNVNYVANGIMKEINKDVRNQITNGSKNNKVLAIANKPVNNKKNNRNADVEYVANQILKQLQNDVAKEIRLGGRAAEPIYNNSSNSNNNNNKNKKSIQNNPLFEPNMQNNPLYPNNKSNNNKSNNNKPNNKSNNNKNSFNGGPRLGANNNNVSLPPSKNVVNVNNVKVNINNVPKEVEQQENNVRNIIKNMNSERDKLKNKITKELNLIPNNNGVFQERTGLTKGRIGLWARELRAAETIEDLKKIENKLNAKVVLRKNIENKYTKAGLTKVEKMNHRRKVVKLLNNVNKRREEIEMQVKNKKNNNKNSVISNYNSNANNNPNRAKKMKYKSRENFVEAKKVELRELAKKTSTNFGRNIDRMQTRQNVFKLRGRIKGAIKRDEGLSKLGNNKK